MVWMCFINSEGLGTCKSFLVCESSGVEGCSRRGWNQGFHLGEWIWLGQRATSSNSEQNRGH